MKFILVLAAFAAVALATPSSETDRKLLDIIQNIINNLNRPPISVGPAIVEEESPISVGPALVEEENLISVGPALVEEESPISVGPALVEEESPISVGPALVEENIPVGPVIVDENLAVEDVEFPDLVTLPALPEFDDSPININVPGVPSINIVINVNPPAPQQFEEIEPTPILVVDDLEVGPVPVQVGDHIVPTPVIVVDDINEVPSYDEDFVPDPDVYY